VGSTIAIGANLPTSSPFKKNSNIKPQGKQKELRNILYSNYRFEVNLLKKIILK